MPLGRSWFRPEKVQATSSFACQLQSTYKDLSRVDLDLLEGLLVGLGYAATSPDSPFNFQQAQTAAERSGVAGPHCCSFFFHEYGRRVGMVPRSSLKEGKNRQMVEKGTKAPKPTQNQTPKPAGRNSTIL